MLKEIRSDVVVSALLQKGIMGVWYWNAVTDEIKFYPELKSIMGYGEHDLSDSRSSWLAKSSMYRSSGPPALLSESLIDKEDSALQSIVEDIDFVGNNNDHFWFRLNGRVVERDESGAVKRIVGNYVNITDYVMALEEINVQQRFYRSIYDNSAIGIIKTDTSGVILDYNDWVCNKIDCAGKSNIFDIVGQSAKQCFNDTVMGNQNNCGNEFSIDDKWFYAAFAPVVIDNSVLYMHVIVIDITDAKLVRKEIELLSGLQESISKLREIANGTKQL